MDQTALQCPVPRPLGVIIGGSGLIGGTIVQYFKNNRAADVEIVSPNSKRLSLREKEDIKSYFIRHQPSFIVNAAIAPIDSDPLLAYETNYLGTVNLAKVALAFNVPYIHISSASVMPMGESLGENDTLRLWRGWANYRKSKLMAEHTLNYLGEKHGLDYTIIRLAVVYGMHDHKIQGFHRLLFSLASQSMPFLLTRKNVFHSYSSTRKMPYFIDHILRHRREFGCETYNFIDPQPVELAHLILTIKSYLELSVPKEIYIPYPVTRAFRRILKWITRVVGRIGVEVRIPAELMFMKSFYETQTLSPAKLLASSFRDPFPEATVYSEMAELLEYYLTRWEHLNLISSYNKEFFDPHEQVNEFLDDPKVVLESIHAMDFTADRRLNNLL